MIFVKWKVLIPDNLVKTEWKLRMTGKEEEHIELISNNRFLLRIQSAFIPKNSESMSQREH